MGADLVQISGQVCDFHSALCHVWVCMLTFVCAWLTWGAFCWLWNGVDVEWLVVFVCHRSWVGFRTVRADKFLSWQWKQILQRQPSSTMRFMGRQNYNKTLQTHTVPTWLFLIVAFGCVLFKPKPLSLYVTSFLIWLHTLITEESTCLGLYVTTYGSRKTSS